MVTAPAARTGRDIPVLTATLTTERDVFTLRRSAKSIAQAAGLDSRDQVRLATALSELGRDLLRPAAMTVSFAVQDQPAALQVSLRWLDDRTPGTQSLAAVTRLLPQTRYEPADDTPTPSGGRIDITCLLTQPAAPQQTTVDRIRELVAGAAPSSAIDDLQAQTHDLLAALQESHAQRDELARLNEELTETNAGVMALYADLTVEHNDVVERFSQEHELALTLQRSFLPATLPETPGVDLSVRYQASTSTTEIGGDFYEAVQTPDGLLLAVGDVVGHSLQAALVMGELRHALRAYAALGHPPHTLLHHLDHLLALHHPGWTVTLCIVLIDADNKVMHMANAGHLPPLLLPCDGPPRYLREHGPLLGLRLPHPPATSHDITPGARLLMITDGLIETRDSDLDERLQLLSTSAVVGPFEPDALCTTLLEAFATAPADDIVVLAAALLPPGSHTGRRGHRDDGAAAPQVPGLPSRDTGSLVRPYLPGPGHGALP
ncbi:PP2C family protein-serine/threonine phosphatase [Streptomyces sp. NPDC048507]|uniref:PP2C family protein-serine/threonine phosphatase n=1 Tax=Streptomyces sp. NPDC048507 TaxID=3365560 RepID=UPI003713D64B